MEKRPTFNPVYINESSSKNKIMKRLLYLILKKDMIKKLNNKHGDQFIDDVMETFKLKEKPKEDSSEELIKRVAKEVDTMLESFREDIITMRKEVNCDVETQLNKEHTYINNSVRPLNIKIKELHSMIYELENKIK